MLGGQKEVVRKKQVWMIGKELLMTQGDLIGSVHQAQLDSYDPLVPYHHYHDDANIILLCGHIDFRNIFGYYEISN